MLIKYMKIQLFATFFYSFITFTQGYNMVYQGNHKKTVLFYPAKLKNTIPYEVYHTFLDSLKETYHVEIMEENTCPKESDCSEYLLLSHSSGANSLMNTYESLPENIPKKAIFIDPLDFQKYSMSVPSVPEFKINVDDLDNQLRSYFKRDYIGEVTRYFVNKFQHHAKENDENQNNKILLLNHKQSTMWRLFPLIPPIDSFKKDFTNVENSTIIQKDIDSFSHFDILDRPWSQSMNKLTMKQKSSNEETYSSVLIPMIREFYND